MRQDRYLQLGCQLCGARDLVGSAQMLQRLRGVGMLKREEEPDVALVHELFVARVGQMVCRACGGHGLSLLTLEDGEDEQWEAARTCEVCERPIPAERLEVIPDTRRCRDCQQSAEQGEDFAQPEYCPRCGAILILRERGGSGITRYRMQCSECGHH